MLIDSYLSRDLLLVFLREIDKVIVFRTDEERDRRLVETSPLSIPLLDGIQGALPRQVEHEENSDRIVTHEWEHVYEFALATEIPD